MAEIVGSAVATEAVSRISCILSGDKHRHESVEDRAERLEMAVLKIRSVVAVSEDLHISHPPLLHWKAKLKRVAEEGDDLLHMQYKKRALDRVSNSGPTTGSSISRYLIQEAKRLVPLRRKEAELDDNTLRRFERLADGAESFFRLVESGGRPKKSMFLPSLTRSLLAGDSMEFSIRSRSGGDDLIMLWPWLDPGIQKGLQACIVVSHEDEVMWEKNLKMCVVFRLSEATDILAIAIGCLELLPPQFDAAGVAIRRLLTETIGQRGDSSNLSERSIWCRRHIQSHSHSRNDREPSSGEEQRVTGRLLPHSVLQFTAACYASPSIGRSSSPMKDGLRLKLVYHLSPYFFPGKHSNQFDLVEQDDIRKLLPKVTDGFYDGRGQAVTCQRQIWCPQSSMYCTVGPAISQPLTMAQACLMESSGAPRRRGVAKTKSQPVSKSQESAEPRQRRQKPKAGKCKLSLSSAPKDASSGHIRCRWTSTEAGLTLEGRDF